MPEPQAEVLAEQQAELIDKRLATKDDLANLVSKADLKAELAETKAELMRGLFGLIGFQNVLILGAVVALARAFH